MPSACLREARTSSRASPPISTRAPRLATATMEAESILYMKFRAHHRRLRRRRAFEMGAGGRRPSSAPKYLRSLTASFPMKAALLTRFCAA